MAPRNLPLRRPHALERMEARRMLAGAPTSLGPPVLISEFVADNDLSLLTRTRLLPTDEFLGPPEAPDWIELTNVSGQRIDVGGMHLTDDADAPQKWQIPADTLIDIGQQLVLFASGNDIRDTNLDELGYLHTDFRLRGSGEYLALTDHDGLVAHEFTPRYPPQRPDVAFGITMDRRELVGFSAPLDYLIPTDDSLSDRWQSAEFDHPDLIKNVTGPLGFTRETDTPEIGETIGAEIKNRPSTESIQGSITVLVGDPFTATGQVTEWSMFSTRKALAITPLILRSVGDGFEIIGVGQTQVSDGSGAQSFPFSVQSGSDLVGHQNYFLGFKDGDNQVDNRGAVKWGQANTVTALRYNGPQSGNIVVGHQVQDGVEVTRTYSIQATTQSMLTGPLNTNVNAEMVNASSIYLRYRFPAPELETLQTLSLRVRYEDGFVAFLNGQEIARRNAPETLQFDSTAVENRKLSASTYHEEINVSSFIATLNPHENILAIHALDDTPQGPDFLIDAQLTGVGLRSSKDAGFSQTPSPGRANQEMSIGYTNAPLFSVERGFYDEPFTLELTTPEMSAATIYYTLDGSKPGSRNPNSVIYDRPVEISGTSVLRAISHLSGYLPSSTQSHTFIFTNDVIDQPVMNPVITDVAAWADQIPDALRSISTVSLTAEDPLSTVEQGVSVELIHPDGTDGFQIDAGLEATGRSSLTYAKLSLRLHFKERYGPTTLSHDVFDDPTGTTEFDQLLLHSGSGDSLFLGKLGTYIRNRWAWDRQLEMGHPAPRGRFVHTFLNGEYHGLYQLMERPNAAFSSASLGGTKAEYDTINAGRAVDGNDIAWNALRNALGNGYHEVLQYLDVENFADYVLLQFFSGNTWDWGVSNNWMATRKREDGHGFQFYAWDSDVILRPGVREDATGLPGPGALLTHQGGLKQYDEFVQLILDRAPLYFDSGGMFSTERLRSDLDELSDLIRLAIIPETARWGGPRYTPKTWQEAVDWIKDTYVPEGGPGRSSIVMDQMRAANWISEIDTPQFYVDGVAFNGQTTAPSNVVAMTTTEGTIYYTLDGTDPWLTNPTVTYRPLHAETAQARVWIPTDDSIAAQWYQPDFDDQDWTVGKLGAGFDTKGALTARINLDLLDSMKSISSTAYVRLPFEVADPTSIDALQLQINYDDGFVAYLNGVEVARRLAPPDVGWDSRAVDSRLPDATLAAEEINLTRYLNHLQPGENLLAIQGINFSANNGDFLIAPLLRAGTINDFGVSPNARRYSQPVVVPANHTINARAVSSEWSSLRQVTARPAAMDLRISEVMYHPAAASVAESAAGFDTEDFEFIELVNPTDQPIDLSAVKLAQTIQNGAPVGVVFDFASGSIHEIAPGQAVVVVKNREAFEQRYGRGLPVAGVWLGGLSNNAEIITVAHKHHIVQQFAYKDDWYTTTDGQGKSLEIINPDTDNLKRWQEKTGWRESLKSHGSPGTIDRVLGDSNQDGVFDALDLTFVFQAGEYEDSVANNSTFAEGDWDGDGDFTSLDIVLAFQQGHYVP